MAKAPTQMTLTLSETPIELFPDPYGHLAGVTAPESHGLEEHCQVLDQGGTIWKTFLTKSY